VQYVQVIDMEQAKSVARTLAAQGYRRIGMSLFESNWPTPHNEEAARMGRKLGADLVLYAVVGVGTRLQSVPHTTYEPIQYIEMRHLASGRKRPKIEYGAF
jgi:hypothetical protein